MTVDRAKWLSEAGFGLAVHWTSFTLPENPTEADFKRPIEKRISDYLRAVDDFDVDGFVEQVVASGAKFLIFTLAHADMVLPFPLPELDELTKGHTARRDLIAELSDALSKHGIRLILYFNADGPADPEWQKLVYGDPKAHAEVIYKITEAISKRYGDRFAGWWIDDCYDMGMITPAYRGLGLRYDYKRFADALRAGNPDAIVTFNFCGSMREWTCEWARGIADYQAGEENYIHRSPTGRFSGEGGAQWFALSWMDDFWVHDKPGVPTPRYSNEEILAYIQRVKNNGGAFAYNTAIYREGKISEPTMNQLKWLREQGI
jgi:alpha-L-fucosidase